MRVYVLRQKQQVLILHRYLNVVEKKPSQLGAAFGGKRLKKKLKKSFMENLKFSTVLGVLDLESQLYQYYQQETGKQCSTGTCLRMHSLLRQDLPRLSPLLQMPPERAA